MSKDNASETDELDEAEQFDIDFTVMAGELAKLLDDVMMALGAEGVVQPQQAAAA
jgi:DNA recombination-dependent growth factor C